MVIAGYILFQNLSSSNSHFVRSFSPYNCAYSPVARQPSCRVGSTGIQGPPSLSSGPGSRRIRFASWTCINRSQRVLLRCPGIPASRICYYLFFFELLLYFFYTKIGEGRTFGDRLKRPDWFTGLRADHEQKRRGQVFINQRISRGLLGRMKYAGGGVTIVNSGSFVETELSANREISYIRFLSNWRRERERERE